MLGTYLVEELFSYINTLPDVVQTKVLIQIKQKLIDNKIKFQNVSDILQGKNNLLNHETNKSLSTNVIQGINNASLTKIISVCPSKTLESDYLNYTSTNETSSSSVNPKIQQKILNTTEKKINKKISNYACNEYNREFISKNSLNHHKNIHSGIYHQCDICQKQFSHKSSLNCHIRRHKGIKPFKCSICDYSSAAKIDIIRHVPTHTKQRNFSCEICGKSFLTDIRLKDHINNVHYRKIREICEICGFSTHSHDIMRRHHIIKHTDQEIYVCPVCKASIKQKGSFLVHMRIHTGEQPFSCKECPKSFKSSSQLAAHVRIHKEGEYVCEICKHKFKSRSHLQRHIIVHSNAKPYSCPLCSYICNVKANITKHVKTVHHISNFTMKRSKINENTVLPAIERGLNVAEECLKKLSKSGTKLTLQSLQQKEKANIKSFERNKINSKNISKNLSSVQHNSSLDSEISSRDILSDAMKLLTPVSPITEKVISNKISNTANRYTT